MKDVIRCSMALPNVGCSGAGALFSSPRRTRRCWQDLKPDNVLYATKADLGGLHQTSVRLLGGLEDCGGFHVVSLPGWDLLGATEAFGARGEEHLQVPQCFQQTLVNFSQL